MSIIADVIGGITSGALTGTIGAIVGPLFKFLQQRQDNKHELDVMALQIEASKAGAQQRLEEIVTVTDGELAKKAYEFAKPDSTSWKWARALNEIVRPTVTFWFFGTYAMGKIILFWHSLFMEGNRLVVAWDQVWNVSDYQMLSAILFFWFTDRYFLHQSKGAR